MTINQFKKKISKVYILWILMILLRIKDCKPVIHYNSINDLITITKIFKIQIFKWIIKLSKIIIIIL